MPPHQRNVPDHSADVPGKKLTGQAQGALSKINDDIRALNSSILIISQKLKFLVRNEKILGRNILVLNKKFRESQPASGYGSAPAGIQEQFSELTRKLSENSDKISALQSEVENIRETYAKADKVSELKYVIDSINPLEFATLKDVQELAHKPSGKNRK